MKDKAGLSQEGLKLIACITMLIDHIGAVLVPWEILRIIGRVSFPIFCFLLVEGVHYTRNPKKYGTRLLLSVFLSELAFDMAFYGRWNWMHNNVMITLFLGFVALQVIRWKGSNVIKAICVTGLVILAELLHADYGSFGVMLIVLFGVTRELSYKWLIQTLGMLFLFYNMGGTAIYAVLAIIPIMFYSNRKLSHGKTMQWAFYLFYPVHMIALWIIKVMI